MNSSTSILPPDLAAQLSAQNLIVFDGTCVFCSGFYRFVLRFDRDKRFRFATAQSELGQALYAALNLPTDDFETNLVVLNGVVFSHLDSFAMVMGQLRWPWRGLKTLRFLPGWIKNPLYTFIARNRFRILGRSDKCLIPDEKARARFIAQGW